MGPFKSFKEDNGERAARSRIFKSSAPCRDAIHTSDELCHHSGNRDSNLPKRSLKVPTVVCLNAAHVLGHYRPRGIVDGQRFAHVERVVVVIEHVGNGDVSAH